MYKHEDWCTCMKFEKDRDILTRSNFDVNIRLFLANREYKDLVLACCDYIKKCSSSKKEGYKEPHGWSGANAGIPFNIIAFQNEGITEVMINPRIIGKFYPTFVYSNCGSLTLKTPIKVKRYKSIDIDFYDLEGKYLQLCDVPPKPGYTIQHEIAHTNGRLITTTKEEKDEVFIL